jgi:formylglycine-generating enzyme required for sulfatase activity
MHYNCGVSRFTREVKMRKRTAAPLILLLLFALACSQEEREVTPPESRHGMVYIPSGEFLMGGQGDEDEGPVHRVYVDGFYMDETEVTVGQFAEFLNEMGNQVEGGVPWLHIEDLHSKISHVNGEYKPFKRFDNYPIVMVSWYGARAFAEWAGKRLPTEAEWEKAARGGLIGKIYPWGDDETHDHGNSLHIHGMDGWEKTSPAKSFVPNGYGLYDMAGNAWEWCADYYDSEYYSHSPDSNPKGPDEGTYKVLRGGSWISPLEHLRASERFRYYPEYRNFNFGFRCAQDR